MPMTTINVTGMTCEHCVKAITAELSTLSGVHDVEVNLVQGGQSPVTIISAGNLDPARIRAAVEEAGYEVA